MFLRHLKIRISMWLDHLLHSSFQFIELSKLSIGVLMSAERIVLANLLWSTWRCACEHRGVWNSYGVAQYRCFLPSIDCYPVAVCCSISLIPACVVIIHKQLAIKSTAFTCVQRVLCMYSISNLPIFSDKYFWFTAVAVY